MPTSYPRIHNLVSVIHSPKCNRTRRDAKKKREGGRAITATTNRKDAKQNKRRGSEGPQRVSKETARGEGQRRMTYQGAAGEAEETRGKLR